jgi:hypothetical protein
MDQHNAVNNLSGSQNVQATTPNVDLSSLSPEQLMQLVMFSRADNLSKLMTNQGEFIQAKNAEMSKLTTLQNELRGLQSQMKPSDSSSSSPETKQLTPDQMKAIQEYLPPSALGEKSDGKVTSDQLGSILTGLSNYQNTLQNTSQQDVMQLQQWLSSYNNSYETTSQVFAQYGKTIGDITSNIR